LQELTTHLLRAGATIVELNAVRKHLDRLKGGQLARAAAPAPLAALILSDVVGDPLDVIASGPTAPDPTTFRSACQVLERFGLWEKSPASIKSYLLAGVNGQVMETPKPGDDLFLQVSNTLIGSNRLAALAAASKAERLGYRSLLLSTFVEGEAREIGRVAAALAKSIRAYGDPLPAPACILLGGETTVTVRGVGKGGRNQELALGAALGLAGVRGVALMALATDGSDGPTDAAGAVVDGNTIQRAHLAGYNPYQALERNDTYPLLDAAEALMRTGPTGTNVNDLTVLLVAE
jgi:hydroxypyruvate reductase